MSALENLPFEILAETANFLDRESLLNFRLINRNLSNSINHVFVRRFFRSRAVFINMDNLNVLRQISLSEKYRASVTTLAICVHHVSERSYVLERIYNPSPSTSPSTSSSTSPNISSSTSSSTVTSTDSQHLTSSIFDYKRLSDDQKWLMKSGQAAAYLALALNDLPNCMTVGITDLLYDPDRNFRKSSARRWITTRMTSPESIDFVAQLISTTMAAVNASGRMLETFCVSHESQGIEPRQLPQLSPRQLGLPFFKLSSLRLNINFKLDKDDKKVATLLGWIKMFPSLKVLRLAFIPPVIRAQSSSITRNLHVDGMTTLVLYSLNCFHDDLVVLFKRHRKTLRSVTLKNFNLTGCVRPWRSILEVIRDETLIDYIKFSGCYSDKRAKSSGAYSQGLRLMIPTGSHKFREELDAKIRVLDQ